MSWVIVNKATNETICELWNIETVYYINTEKYKAIPVREYLENLNKQVKQDMLFDAEGRN